MISLISLTCYLFLIISATHIGPESFSFPSGENDAKALTGGNRVYLMRPETVESYFVLWRAKHDSKYREWAWDAIQVCISCTVFAVMMFPVT